MRSSQKSEKYFRRKLCREILLCHEYTFKLFKSRNAKREEIYKILINIDPNKVYGIDEIPGRFLKDAAKLLTEPLCKIINLSLTSKFPYS